jgi:hypothetical protein
VSFLNPSPPVQFAGPEGYHNAHLEESAARILKGHSYRDMGVVAIVPMRKGGTLRPYWVQMFNGLIKPPNHPYLTFYAEGFEVGDAFNQAIWGILNNPDLMKWNSGRGPWIYTQEDDNIPPPDALIKLLEDMYTTPYAVISGLYWTKGEGGVPQIWGDPASVPPNYAPQVPIPDTIQECRGTGMGCAVWDIEMFKDPRVRQGVGADGVPVWFRTVAEVDANGAAQCGTQDLSFSAQAQKFGYRFAVDTRIRVGHIDYGANVTW